MQQDNIEYLSGEVKEIMSTPPSWVATWGTCMLIGTVVLMFLVGFLFHFPDIVTGEVTISTETPPITVVSPKSDYISEIKAVDNTKVKTGDLLAVFPSNADYMDVLKLEEDIENIGQLDLIKLQSYRPDRSLSIGELTQAYSNFATAFELVPLDQSGEVDYARVAAVETVNAQYQKQLRSLQARVPSVNAELAALRQELKIASRQYGASVDTADAVVLFKINSDIKSKETELKRIQSEIDNTIGEISKSNVRKLQAQTQANSQAGDAIFQLNQKLDELKKEIKLWKEKYLVIAPGGGIVQFYSNFKVKDFVNGGDILFNIMPEFDTERYIGKVNLPVAKSSKVKKGQFVNIKFERYDFREHGTVRARVTKVYPVAKENAFYADLNMDHGLVTNLNHKLDYYQNMVGKAEIITEDKTFISKLFEKLMANF
ncbi:MAG: HlyD family efflux transporter periplasmic adaptor subunit [Saprospiraceae bacterium]|nr:HlyD family efflux transporter periplasmic adaptor subunit [Saprospiraceae bacterium]